MDSSFLSPFAQQSDQNSDARDDSTGDTGVELFLSFCVQAVHAAAVTLPTVDSKIRKREEEEQEEEEESQIVAVDALGVPP